MSEDLIKRIEFLEAELQRVTELLEIEKASNAIMLEQCNDYAKKLKEM